MKMIKINGLEIEIEGDMEVQIEGSRIKIISKGQEVHQHHHHYPLQPSISIPSIWPYPYNPPITITTPQVPLEFPEITCSTFIGGNEDNIFYTS